MKTRGRGMSVVALAAQCGVATTPAACLRTSKRYFLSKRSLLRGSTCAVKARTTCNTHAHRVRVSQ